MITENFAYRRYTLEVQMRRRLLSLSEPWNETEMGIAGMGEWLDGGV